MSNYGGHFIQIIAFEAKTSHIKYLSRVPFSYPLQPLWTELAQGGIQCWSTRKSKKQAQLGATRSLWALSSEPTNIPTYAQRPARLSRSPLDSFEHHGIRWLWGRRSLTPSHPRPRRSRCVFRPVVQGSCRWSGFFSLNLSSSLLLIIIIYHNCFRRHHHRHHCCCFCCHLHH